jgi:hypothetical protein
MRVAATEIQARSSEFRHTSRAIERALELRGGSREE